ncbi:conserved hypothetical protein [Echinococcus multilocularis]|uniref:Uncharacterized protein n=1 Tax=Echinococcus multilocularis TaxID=6211 RepID=A0A068YGC5_ECHMU|nr:conserved hypothetical protein [Echinococcus multilocularis]
MAPVGGVGFKYWRKRIKPLRPWLIGLRIPEIIRELADVVPFIYLCCKLSIVEQSWATQPRDPKAVIVKDRDSLKLCDGQFWIELSLNEDSEKLMVCGTRYTCFFVVFLNEYSMHYDFNLGRFVAQANEVKFVKETHCLEQAFGSIPCIMTCKEELLAQPSTPLSDVPDLSDYSFGDDMKKKSLGISCSCSNTGITQMIEEERLNADNGVVVERQGNCATVDQWIPTQNASGETPTGPAEVETDVHLDTSCIYSHLLSPDSVNTRSNGAPSRGENSRDSRLMSEDVVSGTEGELDCPKRLSCTPPEKVISNSDIPLFCGDNSPFLNGPGLRTLPDLNSDRLRLLKNLANTPALVWSTDRSSFLHWLGAQEATVEICYLEETVHAIDELKEITPARPFSEHFINFAFSD